MGQNYLGMINRGEETNSSRVVQLKVSQLRAWT